MELETVELGNKTTVEAYSFNFSIFVNVKKNERDLALFETRPDVVRNKRGGKLKIVGVQHTQL